MVGRPIGSCWQSLCGVSRETPCRALVASHEWDTAAHGAAPESLVRRSRIVWFHGKHGGPLGLYAIERSSPAFSSSYRAQRVIAQP